MTIDGAIRQHGFRRWYERRLIESHAYLVTGVLALLGMMVVLEVAEFRSSPMGFLTLIATAAAGGMLCIYAFRRFTRLMFGAEHVAGQACCPQCTTYARFRLVSAVDAPDTPEGRAMTVCCRVCETQWTIR